MKQTINKIVEQKTKINRDFVKKYYNLEMNKRKNEFDKETLTIKRDSRDRKKNI